MTIPNVRVQESDVPVFMCIACTTPLALWAEFLPTPLRFNDDPILKRSRLFAEAMNLGIDPAEQHTKIGNVTLARVTCVGCNAHVGYKFAKVEGIPNEVFVEGRVVLEFDAMVFWDGEEMQNAETRAPLEYTRRRALSSLQLPPSTDKNENGGPMPPPSDGPASQAASSA